MNIVRDNSGKWLDTSVFRKAGETFMKNGYYCPDLMGLLLGMSFGRKKEKDA